MKGDNNAYVIAIIFTFVLGVSSFVALYSDTLTGKDKQLHNINSFLGLPDELVQKMLSGESMKSSMRLVSIINEKGAKGFLIENTGDSPLTGFKIVVDDTSYEPYAAPSMLLPKAKSAILVGEEMWQKIVEKQKVAITSLQGVSLSIFAANI